MDILREKTVLCLHQIFNKQQLPEDTQAVLSVAPFAKMLFLTTCRHSVSLQKIINNFIAKKISTKNILLNTILLTATTELLLMNSPDYAVLNDYVEIAKKHCGKFSSGFINAVLRNITKNKEDIKKTYTQHFFPNSFKKLLAKDYSNNEITKIEKASLSEPPLNLSVKENIILWAEQFHTSHCDETLILRNTGKIEELEGYQQGQWWVQDIAASLAVKQFSNLKGKHVLDLCAAPGGKTAQLLSLGAKVTSLDCNENRLKTLRQNLQRLNLDAEKIICADALQYLSSFNQKPFDAILLDAPCSATGVFRRHPELVYLKTPTDISSQATLQKNILDHISPALKVGGQLVYCVCSIAHDEGEKQIKAFLEKHHNFHICPLQNKSEPYSITPEGFIRTLPYHYFIYGGCDAFFIAKLIKDTPDD